MKQDFSLYCICTGWTMIAACILAHLLLLWLPGVNLEFTFSDAARYFIIGDSRYLDEYFHYEANTLTVPWLSYFASRVFPWINIDHIPRLLSILSIIPFSLGLMRINARLGNKISNPVLLVVVLLNPLVWTFSGRGTADFLPVAIALYALSLFWEDNLNWPKRLLASLVWGIAALIKYHALLLMGVVVAEIAFRHRTHIKKIILESLGACLPATVLVALYVLWAKQTFGFWFTPPVFQAVVLKLTVASALDNIVAYSGYLILLTLPLSVFVSWQTLVSSRTKYWALLFLALAFTAGYYCLSDNGEMNLGPLDSFISKPTLAGILAVLSVVLIARFLLPLHAPHNQEIRRYMVSIIGGMVVFLLALSCSRPAQRYLLFVVPLLYFFLLPYGKSNRAMVAITVLASLLINLFIAGNQYATGTAAADLTEQLAAHNLLAKTDPGVIDPHVGNVYFLFRANPKAFTIVSGNSNKKILSGHSASFPFIIKTYSLVPLPPPTR